MLVLIQAGPVLIITGRATRGGMSALQQLAQRCSGGRLTTRIGRVISPPTADGGALSAKMSVRSFPILINRSIEG